MLIQGKDPFFTKILPPEHKLIVVLASKVTKFDLLRGDENNYRRIADVNAYLTWLPKRT